MADTMAAQNIAAHDITTPATTLRSDFPWLRVMMGAAAAGVLLLIIAFVFVGTQMLAARTVPEPRSAESETAIAPLPPTPTAPVQAPTQPAESTPAESAPHRVHTPVARPASRPLPTTRVESAEVPAEDPHTPARPTSTETRTGQWNPDDL